jgi:glycosyltransferase involved in cell wall biosynthesis
VEKWSAMVINQKPKISVLMTAFNAESYINKAVDSVLKQNFKNWELIVVDNKSTDNTLKILERFRDFRVNLIKLNKNIGRVAALRLAYDEAKGEYIAILDADDVSNINRLKKQSNYLDSNPKIGLVASWIEFIDGNGQKIGEFRPPIKPNEIHQCLGFRNITLHSSVMYRKRIADKAGGYSKDFIWGHDFNLILSIAKNSDIAILNSFLSKIRIIKTSMTRSLSNKEFVALEKILLFKKAGKILNLNDQSKKMNKTAIAISNVQYEFVLASTRKNYFFRALFLIFREIIFNPALIWRNGYARRLFGYSF